MLGTLRKTPRDSSEDQTTKTSVLWMSVARLMWHSRSALLASASERIPGATMTFNPKRLMGTFSAT